MKRKLLVLGVALLTLVVALSLLAKEAAALTETGNLVSLVTGDTGPVIASKMEAAWTQVFFEVKQPGNAPVVTNRTKPNAMPPCDANYRTRLWVNVAGVTVPFDQSFRMRYACASTPTAEVDCGAGYIPLPLDTATACNSVTLTLTEDPVPALSIQGLILFLVLGIGATLYMRRRRSTRISA